MTRLTRLTRLNGAALVLVSSAVVSGLVGPSADAAALTCDGLTVTIRGTARADHLRGTSRADVIAGLGGNDTIEARGGDDHVCGGDGKDLVTGADGRDRLRGEAGADVVDGGPGSDFLLGGGGADTLFGAAGNDAIGGGPGADRLESGTNATAAILRGDSGDDVLVVQGAGTTAYGGTGEDTLRVSSDAGPAELDGGDDPDELVGGPSGDRLHGDAGADSVDAGGGADTVLGGTGDDALLGGPGADVLRGESGTDTCDGEGGTDACHGGSPGTSANSPDDPDVCAAETRTSCRALAAPQQWLVHVAGTTWWRPALDHEERTDWKVDARLDLSYADGGTRRFLEVPGSVTGQWEVTGSNGDCAIAGSGTYEPSDFDYTLVLHGTQTYDVDLQGLYAASATWRCPGSEDVERLVQVDAKEMVDGLPFEPDPADGTLGGTRDVVGDHDNTTHYTWTLTPVTG